ncbi:exodeoxyribonuclease V subunit alpha [Candidatus Francisella endociliophora]|uniref:RecBCD enzyme subunit RecD n=1 Tax=Candidatus Francisella endociliophora TaxID=653937 RepID=A0A097ER94_9GAMM|nr:exodeoxyribonuclease V subunit alpha [Francisella sp. FSC1006]AIT10062.1 exodeoxyribonuclease V subunit alpha [Francisella sp. FSC1006]
MYKTFKEASQSLDIRPVDFFFAKEVLEEIKVRYKIEQTSANILLHLLMKLMSEYGHGHSCIRLKEVADTTVFASDIADDEPKEGFKLPEHKQLLSVLTQLNYDNLPIYFTKDFDSLYIKKLCMYEKEIADFIKLKTVEKIKENRRIEEIVYELFESSDEIDWQKQAVIKSLSYDFSIISGGPGTGKTTTVAKLLLAMQIMECKQQKIALLAPTGKAAQRMTESLRKTLANTIPSGLTMESIMQENEIMNYTSTPLSDLVHNASSDNYLQNLEAQTIHRFLGLRPNSKFVKYGEKTKAPFDVIIVDEASMLDVNIFIKLIRAVGEDTKLILLGDVNQLPSVEAGSLLANFTTSIDGSISKFTAKLIKNYRSQQNINNLASDVLLGDVDIAKHQNENISFYDFKWLDKQLQVYADKYKELQLSESHKEALHQLNKFRVLVANKNLEIGTDRLNQKIEQLLGRAKDTIYKGKPIMITQNSYSLGLFNGDVGIIWPDNTGALRAYFDGKEDRAFSLNMLPQYESVYAMTIHKTQGLEFDEVAIILPPEDNEALTKQLLYTGITRAKTKLDVISAQKIFKTVIKKDLQRNSNIARLLS